MEKNGYGLRAFSQVRKSLCNRSKYWKAKASIIPSLSAGWLVCSTYCYDVQAQFLAVKAYIGVDSAIEGIERKGVVMSIRVWN